jgi:hypothetical protein
MARGVSTVGETEEEARESILRDHPELKIVACEPIDMSDIPLRVPLTQQWAVAIEDPDPSKFVQDDDPIGKIIQEVRHTYSMIVADPESLTTGMIEGPFNCPGCSKAINFEIPPGRITRRMPARQKVFSKCPECDAKVYRLKGAPRDQWHLEPPRTRLPAPPLTPPDEGFGLRRACIFCGAEDRKISKEHLWSKWMRAHVEGSGGSGTSGRLIASETGIVKSHERWPGNGFDRQVSGPCKQCNEGWMGDLEREVAPLLIPMLRNEVTQFRPEAQQTIARWATLKVLVAQQSHPSGKQTVPAARYRRFFVDRQLPSGAQIWIGRRNGEGSWPTDYQYHELFMTPGGEDEPTNPNAYLVAFSIGYLAFFYWGHELQHGPVANLGEVASFVSQVWPATGVSSWPPQGLLKADGLKFIMNRFPLRGWA